MRTAFRVKNFEKIFLNQDFCYCGVFYVKKLSKENKVAEIYSKSYQSSLTQNGLLTLFREVGYYGYTKAPLGI